MRWQKGWEGVLASALQSCLREVKPRGLIHETFPRLLGAGPELPCRWERADIRDQPSEGALASSPLPRCVTLPPPECGCAGDVISRIPLTSQEMPL